MQTDADRGGKNGRFLQTSCMHSPLTLKPVGMAVKGCTEDLPVIGDRSWYRAQKYPSNSTITEIGVVPVL